MVPTKCMLRKSTNDNTGPDFQREDKPVTTATRALEWKTNSNVFRNRFSHSVYHDYCRTFARNTKCSSRLGESSKRKYKQLDAEQENFQTNK